MHSRFSATLLVALLSAVTAIPARADFMVTPISLPTEEQYEAVNRALPPDDRGELFRSREADLNGDERPDLIGQFTYRCSQTGCKSFALLATVSGYAAHTISLPTFVDSVTVLDTVHRGMRDLRFDDARYVYHWDGKAYR